ncbi:hypothetical protein EV1_028173 [Malus domestica]
MFYPNYSTMLLPVPSSTNLTALTSAGGALLSPAFPSPSSAAAAGSWGPIDPLLFHCPLPIQSTTTSTQITTTPAVCGFSGLPLFPPEKTPPSNLTTAATTISAMEDGSSAATTWIDGIIKDLIHSSTNVPIPQLIHNVREIIFPCNPSLAALLWYRLRSISDPPPPLCLLSTLNSSLPPRAPKSDAGIETVATAAPISCIHNSPEPHLLDVVCTPTTAKPPPKKPKRKSPKPSFCGPLLSAFS